MLEIVKFIREHEDWEDLLARPPYSLRIMKDCGYVLFKYSQIDSDFNEVICQEARGLILDSLNDYQVVRYAFRKFFNIAEQFAAPIDWSTAVASEKIDGSIMSVWFSRGEWHISTNGTIDAFKAETATFGKEKTFGDLFSEVLPLSTFEGKNLENYCFTFELVSPFTKIVIDYPETKVYLLSVRDMRTLVEIPYTELPEFAQILNVDTPQLYLLESREGYCQMVEQMGEGHEGIVVRDAQNQRVKIKTRLYFEMHRVKNNGVINLERIVELVRANDQAEFLSYFPEYTEMFKKVETQIEQAKTTITSIRQEVIDWKLQHQVGGLADSNERKMFAKTYGQHKYKAFYFAGLQGKLDSLVASLSAKKFIKMFDITM